MSTKDPKRKKRTDTDQDEPHENRPLYSRPARDEDGREHTAFFETKDRARHAGQWPASTATISTEEAR